MTSHLAAHFAVHFAAGYVIGKRRLERRRRENATMQAQQQAAAAQQRAALAQQQAAYAQMAYYSQGGAVVQPNPIMAGQPGQPPATYYVVTSPPGSTGAPPAVAPVTYAPSNAGIIVGTVVPAAGSAGAAQYTGTAPPPPPTAPANITQQPSAATPAKIPSHFLACGCCAVTCMNCDTSHCVGHQATAQCVCCTCSNILCKYFSSEGCICSAQECLIGSCNSGSCCAIYKQCCCLELLCALPSLDVAYGKIVRPVSEQDVSADASASDMGDGALADGNVHVCLAHCCYIDSCNCDFPSCLGCSSVSNVCCFMSSCMACTPTCGNEEKGAGDDDLLCILVKQGITCTTPKTCCKSIIHCCCVDRRCALPCDADVPCMLTCLPFCVCCVNGKFTVACGQTIDELLGRENLDSKAAFSNVTPAAPAAQPAPVVQYVQYT